VIRVSVARKRVYIRKDPKDSHGPRVSVDQVLCGSLRSRDAHLAGVERPLPRSRAYRALEDLY